MKKILTIAALTGVVLASCSKDKEPQGSQINIKGLEMTAGYVVWMAGSGTASIDWGDGSAAQTLTLVTLASSDDNYLTNAHKVTPPYTDFTKQYNITITGNLTGLRVPEFGITALDLNMSTLEVLGCDDNSLTTLDMSKCPVLKFLDCSYNNLTALDLNKCPMMRYLYCRHNNLAALDVSKCIALTRLDCYDNNLSTLSLATHAGLSYVDCSNNRLSKASLVGLFEKLPMRLPADGARIWCGGISPTIANPGYAELTAADKKKAEDKNWEVLND